METEVPVVHGKLVQRRGVWQAEVTCPYCRKRHVHGAGVDGKGGNGHRAAHCAGTFGQRNGYVIECKPQ